MVSSQVHQSITYKGLFPVVIAANLWGSQWSKKHVLFPSDHEAVVAILSSRTSKVPVLMHLLCNLLLSAVRCGFTFTAIRVPGVDTKVAEAISCLAGILMPCSKGSLYTLPNPSASSGQLDTSLLEEHCRFLLVQGLAQSPEKSYASGQRRFYDFCLQAG